MWLVPCHSVFPHFSVSSSLLWGLLSTQSAFGSSVPGTRLITALAGSHRRAVSAQTCLGVKPKHTNHICCSFCSSVVDLASWLFCAQNTYEKSLSRWTHTRTQTDEWSRKQTGSLSRWATFPQVCSTGSNKEGPGDRTPPSAMLIVITHRGQMSGLQEKQKNNRAWSLLAKQKQRVGP